MASSSTFKLLSLLVLLNMLNFAITQAQGPTFVFKSCSESKTAANSAFQTDLKTLFSSLTSNATDNTEFYNATVPGTTGRNSSDTVYGLFMCRGDFPSCGQCVLNATQTLSSDSDCSLSKEAVIWYDECMVRYSNRSFFSTVATAPMIFLWNTAYISNQETFMKLLTETITETADEAAKPPALAKKYATKQANISGFQTLYCMSQCSEDLSPQGCRTCLSQAIEQLPTCCGGKQGGRVLVPSCNVRYELYPFYQSVAPGPTGHVPGRNASDADSRYSEDPIYLSHNCSIDENFTVNSDFQSNLRTLLHYLSSNATRGSELFKKDEVVETVYGLFMCRGDLSPRLCGQCVMDASNRISSSECRFSTEAIIWYSHCLLRYSPQNIASEKKTSPVYKELNITPYSTQGKNYFTSILSNTLSSLANHTGDSTNRYRTDERALNPSQTVYALAQCTPDLSSDDCGSCLNDVIGSAIPWARLGSVGGRVLYPSCNLRFELFQFYRDGDEAQPPTEKGKRKSLSTILIAVFSSVSGILLFFIVYDYSQRKFW